MTVRAPRGEKERRTEVKDPSHLSVVVKRLLCTRKRWTSCPDGWYSGKNGGRFSLEPRGYTNASTEKQRRRREIQSLVESRLVSATEQS